MASSYPSPNMQQLNNAAAAAHSLFLDDIAPQLGLSVDSSTDKVVEIQVFMTSYCGTERTEHILMQDQLPLALDLARRLHTIPQLRYVYAAITLERYVCDDATPIGTSAGTAILRNRLYCQPGLGLDTWSEDGWTPYGEENMIRVS